jgi:diacylglycerol kinase (ATP)
VKARVRTAENGCDTLVRMRAAVLLGLEVAERGLRPFQASGIELIKLDDLHSGAPVHAALVFGGDGTIHRHLRTLIEQKIPVLPVPMGSGNDFAHALGMHSIHDAVTAWQQFCSGTQNVKTIDAGLICSQPGHSQLETGNSKPETYFCNVAGVGLDVEANRRANAMPRWLRRHGGYIFAAVSAILSFRPTVVTITTNDGKISQPATLVAVANSTSYGGGMRIAPHAQLADGLLDICFIRQTGRFRLLRGFPRVFRGEHLTLPEAEYFQASRLRIEAERPLLLYADGEPVCETPLEIEVVPKALQVVVPMR